MYRMILEKVYLEDVINPQYAFPIVGVILCALLVFAFGFKTPAQPPSFDFVDVQHRKATSKKKQKSKEKQQTKLVQNGTVQNQSSLPETSTDSKSQSNDKSDIKPITKSKDVKEKRTPSSKVIPTKTVPSKSLPTKAQTIKGQQQAKSEAKGKSKKSTKDANSNKQKETEVSPPTEEVVGDGWAQILSRKEKKSRKKDDVINTEVKKLLNSETSSSKKKKKVVNNDTTRESAEVPPKTVDPADTNIQAQNVESPKASKKKSGNNADDSPKSEAKKGKDSTVKPSEPTVKTSNAKKEALPEKILKQSDSPKSRPVDETPIKNETVEQIKEAGKTDEKASSNDATNVVFDELGDMWQDAKPQKKKKKARRD